MKKNILNNVNEIEYYKFICPSLIGDEIRLVKELLALQLFINNAEKEKLNILFVGDVGSGKSKLAQDCSKIIPNSKYLTHKTTPAGLKDIMFSSKNTILYCDEFTRWDKVTRETLLETMESGIFTSAQSIRNDGYIEVEVNISVSAFCNPYKDKINKNIPIHKQVNLGNALLSRMHLVVPIYKVDNSLYPEIAKIMATPKEYDEKRRSWFRTEIIKAKETIPSVDVSGYAEVVGRWIKMKENISLNPELYTPRIIDGFLNCLKARARMNGRNVANDDDYNYVIDLFDKFLY